tara:strand:+ start:164 stop:526 length:363 start_codon:yes stop_codon:yes gene_type:complete
MLKRLLKRKISKKIRSLRKKYKKTKKKLKNFLYLSKRKSKMGCNCGKSKKGTGDFVITDPDTRMFLCRQCPESRETSLVGLTCGRLAMPEYFDDGKQKNCGCILKLKTAMKKQRCPQGKW